MGARMAKRVEYREQCKPNRANDSEDNGAQRQDFLCPICVLCSTVSDRIPQ